MRACEHGPEECRSCWIDRIRSISFAPSATPSRRNGIAPSRPNNSWEKGTPTRRRAGGTQMPYLMPNGTVATQKEHAENRHLWPARERITAKGAD